MKFAFQMKYYHTSETANNVENSTVKTNNRIATQIKCNIKV